MCIRDRLRRALAEILRRIKEKGPILLADMTKRKNEETLADVAPALRYADYVFPNLDEAYLLTGSRDPAAIARQFLACGVKTVSYTHLESVTATVGRLCKKRNAQAGMLSCGRRALRRAS